MAKDLVQKTFEFMKEEPSKKIKATLFQKIILGAMISAPFVIVGGHYVVKHEVERMNKEINAYHSLYTEIGDNAKNAALEAFVETARYITDPEGYDFEDKKGDYSENNGPEVKQKESYK